ncbi:MAG: hypothetical protein ACM3OC_02125 [Deltaproteobacteria bacterium]
MARKMTKDYAMSDVEAVWRRGDFNSYQEVEQWLKARGNADNELTPGEVMAMEEDIMKLEQQNAQFTKDPDQAFTMMHKGRGK